ncbi:MAG: hypothetical protein FWE36_06310 [Erysipelotrichales bacterium]|nr:hypothetical protein [Erysipelotrichales bacterium]
MKNLFKILGVFLMAGILAACSGTSLQNALDNTIAATNYSVTFTFTSPNETILETTIDFDGNLARRSSQNGAIVSFYENVDNKIYRYDQFGDVWQKIDVTADAEDAFFESNFLNSLSADLFNSSGGNSFTLLPNYYIQLGELFGGEPVSNLILTIERNHINEVTFIVVIDNITINGRIVFSNFGSVSLTLPTI